MDKLLSFTKEYGYLQCSFETKVLSSVQYEKDLKALKNQVNAAIDEIDEMTEVRFQLLELKDKIKLSVARLDESQRDFLPGGKIYEEQEKLDRERFVRLCSNFDKNVHIQEAEYKISQIRFDRNQAQHAAAKFFETRHVTNFFPGDAKSPTSLKLGFDKPKVEKAEKDDTQSDTETVVAETVLEKIEKWKHSALRKRRQLSDFEKITHDETGPSPKIEFFDQFDGLEKRFVEPKTQDGVRVVQPRVKKTRFNEGEFSVTPQTVDTLKISTPAKSVLKWISSKNHEPSDESLDLLLPSIETLISEMTFAPPVKLAKVAFLASGSGKTHFYEKWPNLVMDIDALPNKTEERIIEKLRDKAVINNDWSTLNRYWNCVVENHVNEFSGRVLLAHHMQQVELVLKYDGIIVITERSGKPLSDFNRKALLDTKKRAYYCESNDLMLFIFWYFRNDIFIKLYV